MKSLLKNKPIVTPIKRHKYSLAELKAECKKLGITNSVQYKKQYKLMDGFPAHPERTYDDEWLSYNDFFDIPEFVTYQDLKLLVQENNFESKKEYTRFLVSLNDPTLPFDPQTVYGSEWENWYRFLGKEEPYRPDFIHPDYFEWAEKIRDFMKQARGGESKISHLCRFVRYFVEYHDKSRSPRDLLIKKKVDVRHFRVFLDSLTSKDIQRKIIIAVNEFLDFVIDSELTIEDDETGEIVRVMEARNPFSLLSPNQTASVPTRSETTKPHLQYHFVKKAQEWIIPKGAKTFRHLKHLQKFDADWLKVDKADIDTHDPDCVYRIIDRQYFMWMPMDWIQTYALTKIPLRGVQIAYNDSGEADHIIADIDESGKIVWVENTSDFAGMTVRQSFIMQMIDEQIGTYVTTNKTKNDGQGYSIPWMPADLAYWLVKLRKWQQKYNPILKPTSWQDCVRTNFNEIQLKAKGINCFLFRAYKDIEPKNVSNALAPRLAAALYNVQPSNLVLARLEGNAATLSHYESKYTPHSMRVSLITAYVMEMGMPIEVVMKIVGHSSVVMSIYYCKVSNHDIRQRLEHGEKIALLSQAQATQQMIEQNKIEDVKNDLVASNHELLNALTNNIPAGNFVFKDFGICPFAASRCDDGGEVIGASQVRAATPNGYLGYQNCLRCRHFVTGPAYLGGLLSITNEILLQSNIQSSHCHSLQEKLQGVLSRLNEVERMEYLASIKNESFDHTERKELESKERILESDYGSAAMKLDVLLCDLQAAYGLVRRCQGIINKEHTDAELEAGKYSLVTMADSELVIEMEEVSYYQQLQDVCENATIYQSATAHNAVLPRTQLLDRMALFNNIAPKLFLMSEDEQLRAGNELYNLLKNRLKTWDKIEQIVNCDVKLEELLGEEKITASEIKLITTYNSNVVSLEEQ